MISVLSLAGIPPLAGFFAKYYIFSAALQEGYPVLVLIAVIGSLVGVYYYFRLVIAMFSSEHTNTEKVTISFPEKSVLLLISIASLLLGIMPGFFVELL
jgi:NADH-quinone oxidoreductase subunit N